MPNEDAELKPCPVCRYPAMRVGGQPIYITCGNPKCFIQHQVKVDWECPEIWNTRAKDNLHKELVLRLEQCVRRIENGRMGRPSELGNAKAVLARAKDQP